MCLLGCVSFVGDPIGYARVLGLIYFELTPRFTSFLTSETHVVIARLCLLLPTPLVLSPQKATPILTTLALSP
jgi:hypothetical protein